MEKLLTHPFTLTRAQLQRSSCKDLKPKQPFRVEATYTPISKRLCSRSGGKCP
ncbi:transcriptional regulator [Lacticaseibacillus casei]|nr:transcriptional regulator [Lacticaseibacillus casei]